HKFFLSFSSFCTKKHKPAPRCSVVHNYRNQIYVRSTTCVVYARYLITFDNLSQEKKFCKCFLQKFPAARRNFYS
ncbi:MAG: hypothetical protein J1E64_09110, partial [Acetatifactor sp.]|nr:hypothetical protein [Acetatifactor sp.]